MQFSTIITWDIFPIIFQFSNFTSVFKWTNLKNIWFDQNVLILSSIIVHRIWNIIRQQICSFFFNSIFIQNIFCFYFRLFAYLFIKSSSYCCNFYFIFEDIVNCFLRIALSCFKITFSFKVSPWLLNFQYLHLETYPKRSNYYWVGIYYILSFLSNTV